MNKSYIWIALVIAAAALLALTLWPTGEGGDSVQGQPSPHAIDQD